MLLGKDGVVQHHQRPGEETGRRRELKRPGQKKNDQGQEGSCKGRKEPRGDVRIIRGVGLAGGKLEMGGVGVRGLQSREQEEMAQRGLNVEEELALEIGLRVAPKVLLVPHHLRGARDPRQPGEKAGGGNYESEKPWRCREPASGKPDARGRKRGGWTPPAALCAGTDQALEVGIRPCGGGHSVALSPDP